MSDLYGAIEAGGTKFVCAYGSGPDDIAAEARFPTEDPTTTLGNMVAFFTEQIERVGPADGFGVASFGPIELRKDHPQYGCITTTPKAGWSGTQIIQPLADAFGARVGFDTDVNGAGLGEGRWGAAKGLSTFVYVTIGTGIGGGAIVDGKPLHGLTHPEMGHVAVRRKPRDAFGGICPFHGDCFEGMASGQAMAARWGTPAEELTGSAQAEAVAVEAWYVAQGFRSIVYTCAPERIVMGGGVTALPGLLDAVRAELGMALAGYPGLAEHDQAEFVVLPGLGGRSGIAGAFALAATVAAGD